MNLSSEIVAYALYLLMTSNSSVDTPKPVTPSYQVHEARQRKPYKNETKRSDGKLRKIFKYRR